ncbi:MAG: ribokinase [Proteobacteria bacterium]|nr:ribokinase [Pseudomonadota bacterium]
MIVVFGALNMDMVMRVPEMPRPGNTVVCPGYDLIPGGKGANQAVAASLCEQEVHFFGCVGRDEFAKRLRLALGDARVNTDHLRTCQDVPTGCATICVDGTGENVIVVAAGANTQVSAQDVPDTLLHDKTLLMVQCEVPQEESWTLIARAKERGAKVLLNLAPACKIPLTILESIDYLVLNEIEITILALHLGFDAISPTLAAKRITATHGVTCIVTLGAQGAFACAPHEEWEVPALRIMSVDTTAAGDAFCGALAAQLDKGASLKDALKFAAVASSLTCTRMGAQTSLPTHTEISHSLERLHPLKKVR